MPVLVSQADRNEKGWVSQMFRGLASLAGIVLTFGSRQGHTSPRCGGWKPCWMALQQGVSADCGGLESVPLLSQCTARCRLPGS